MRDIKSLLWQIISQNVTTSGMSWIAIDDDVYQFKVPYIVFLRAFIFLYVRQSVKFV